MLLLTGDGISNVIHSAEIAARTLLEALDRGVELSVYDERILEEIGQELLWSRKLLSFLTAFPRVIYRAVARYERVWRAFGRTMVGEDSLLLFQRKIQGIGPLLGALEGWAERREQRALSGGAG